ncbi:MAG TPA: 23S rRNA (pseudouridine(1915)-N(3))-methyltransferase RlmH [Chitinophagaceae bacterium]|jgi:23S rRNA (pseudouridine1915-N3)-methyltransferase|nr:23S rRNA (pseudouridine(1915)-N(3))-methyltransferase RlmH [Chitinophagaceae bacterium]
MKIECWAIGKPHESYVAEGVNDYTKRIENYYPIEWRLFSLKKNAGSLSQQILKQEESALIIASLKPEDWLVSLDENGKTLSSRKLAGFIQDRGNESIKRLIFLIGGSYGLDEPLLKKSKFIWSLSPLTFPHQLVRLILAEQIYRACTIGRNEKYHHA